jgi:hypothetical protein
MSNSILELLRSEHALFKLCMNESHKYQPWAVQNSPIVTVKELQSISCRDLFSLGFSDCEYSMMLIPYWAQGLIADGEKLWIVGGFVTVGWDWFAHGTWWGPSCKFQHPGLKEFENAAA